MPHIFVTYDLPWLGPEIDSALLDRLADDLPIICAEYLNTSDEGGSLTENDFSVTFLEKGQHDLMTHHLQIRVEAHSFPGRLANIDERTDKIRDAIKLSLDGWKERPFKMLQFYVWVRLSPAGFSTGTLNPI